MILRPSVSALAGEEVPQGVVVVLVEGSVYERVEEGVGVAQPQEDALPDGRDVAGAQRHDELGDEEGDPAEDEDADQDAHHQRRLLLLLLAPRVAIRLEGDGGVAHGEHHLRPRLLLHLVFRRPGVRGGKKTEITQLGGWTDGEEKMRQWVLKGGQVAIKEPCEQFPGVGGDEAPQLKMNRESTGGRNRGQDK